MPAAAAVPSVAVPSAVRSRRLKVWGSASLFSGFVTATHTLAVPAFSAALCVSLSKPTTTSSSVTFTVTSATLTAA